MRFPGSSTVEHSAVNCTAEHHKPLFWRRLATKLSPLIVPQLCPDYMNIHVPTCTERIRRRGGRLASFNGPGSRRIHPPCVIDAGTQGICRTDFRVEWIWLFVFGVLKRSAWPKSSRNRGLTRGVNLPRLSTRKHGESPFDSKRLKHHNDLVEQASAC